MKRFTWLVAAVTKAAQGLGVYWGDARATHPAEDFVAIAESRWGPLSMMLWSGVSEASDDANPDRMSLLSLGMSQLDLPDLELTVPRSADKGATVTWFFQLLDHMVQRGAPFPEGDTVGRTKQEHLKVRYVRSPADPDPNKKVLRVDVP
jgi:hypothetical protein